MTHPTDPSRPAPPTVREIAELTARLRDISARGRDVDPAERARFLADKDALIAGIETAHEREFDELCERHPLPGDGPGEWVTDRNGTRWVDYDAATEDDVSDEIAHIWDAPSSAAGGRHRDPLSCLDTRGPGRADEQERREQLARWHADDQATDATGTEQTVCCIDPALVRGEDR